MQEIIYPIHLKAIPELGIKRDCPLTINFKNRARESLRVRLLKDFQEGLTLHQIKDKYQKYVHA